MNRPSVSKLAILLACLLLIVFTFTSAGGQDVSPPNPGEESEEEYIFETVEYPEENDPGSEGAPAAQAPAAILAQPPYTMNYQGYLTNAEGAPLEGTVDLRFALYDQSAGGAPLWGWEAHDDTPVDNGLFHVVLGETVVLYPTLFDEALFLAVEVNGAVLAERQPLRSTAYAFGLVPGARARGDPENTSYGLYVVNTGSDASDRGIFTSGNQYGLYAEETGDGDTGIYSPDYIQGAGFRSNSDSYLWFDPNKLVSDDITGPPTGAFVLQQYWGGYAVLDCTDAGNDFFLMPMDVPGVLFGQNVRVEEMRVYYRTSDAATYLTATWLYKSTLASGYRALVANTSDNQSSVTLANYSVPLLTGDENILNSSSGPLTAVFELYCANTSHNIYLHGVRLRLGHTP